ncbi:hypothetical protein G6F50_017884 [Rhizopus delemar]|uniref:Uncharacterized protein n=1 Tax=Rhizopus delemar TaxID=936053 RepID=A0A9P7BZP3_9FUNG|nr:hypothetical protein G6F50_017884 [Rhizopus delemar]
MDDLADLHADGVDRQRGRAHQTAHQHAVHGPERQRAQAVQPGPARKLECVHHRGAVAHWAHQHPSVGTREHAHLHGAGDQQPEGLRHARPGG